MTGRSAAFLRVLLEAGIITALKCAWTLAQREEKRSGARMTPEDFFDRGVRDSGKKMEEGDGKEAPARELARGLLLVAVAGEHREAGILRKAGIGEG